MNTCTNHGTHAFAMVMAYNDYFMRCGLIVQIKKENKKERNGNFASLQTTQPCADNEIS